MLKLYEADKDAYITNKVVRGSRMTGSNVGYAGTLDLFKLYGVSFSGTYPNITPNTELSRLLVHFDLSDLRDLFENKKIDVSDDSFWCKLRLRDVYGGQPVPTNFSVSVFPLSASFDEGLGKDVSYYSDSDICNWLSASSESAWFMTGCALACHSTGSGDYITASISMNSTEVRQNFKSGTEDLIVDVTKIVSATLTGELPDRGFRLSFSGTVESDSLTYFVKRFASRHAYDDTKRPRLIVGFDDSIVDDTQDLSFDRTCTVNLYNTNGGVPSDILSGSSLMPVTGANCLLLKLTTPVSGGTHDFFFTGSQYSLGGGGRCYVSGTYTADILLQTSDSVIKSKLTSSSSIVFTPVWTSLDGTVAYVTGSNFTVYPPSRTSTRVTKNYVVSVTGVRDTIDKSEEPVFRVNIFDNTSPFIKVVKLPVELRGTVIRGVHYQIRDAVTDEVVVPFDTDKGSTRVSSDSDGMFFSPPLDALSIGKSYIVDILIDRNGVKTRFPNSSPSFRIISEST